MENGYDKSYPGMLMDHMAKGLSFDSFGGVVEQPISVLKRWVEQYDGFKKAEEIGHLKRQYLWEKMGLLGAQGKTGFDRQAWELLKPPRRR